MSRSLLLALFACKPLEAEPPRPIVPGSPQVGAAEGTLDLPIGTPMGGYSARATYLGAATLVDTRQSPYSIGFVESAGKHTRPGIKVIWVTNGDQDLVLTATDTIYSYDGLVDAMTLELERRTGRELKGRVSHSANHSHNSYGPFSDQVHFYLGGDRFNQEIFARFVGQMVDVAMTAYERLQPAAIGTGWAQDWDPDDRVYRDRRGVNDDLVMFDDLPPGGYGKEPFLNITRFDAADGTPLAMTYAMPIHGTMLEGPLLSADSGGGITHGLEEAFDRPVVVMHLQTGGGDASPAGRGDGLARVESLSVIAPPLMMGLYHQIRTSADPIAMESAARHIWQERDMIHITRDGTMDLYYRPYEAGYASDSEVYEADGSIASPVDEFNAPNGAVFCGSDAPLIPGGGVDSLVPPYDGCVRVDALMPIIQAIFKLTIDETPLPLPESMKAGTMATVIGPIPTLYPDGSDHTDPLYAAFIPAEPTSMYVEQMRRRVRGELGYQWPLIVGYSQDHEGYFLPPEDWLRGGYEPNINMWGPLQGEHVMEGVLAYSRDILGTPDVAEEADPDGYYAPTEYPVRALPTEFVPDETPLAGTLLAEAPAYLYVPDGMTVDLTARAEVARVSGIVQFAWQGGDSMVDQPRVVLETNASGDWAPVLSRAGREVDDRYADILQTWTPFPLYPPKSDQTHTWWAGWQATPHSGDSASLPLGTYRLHAYGKMYTGGSVQWPWATADYDVVSPEFEVVPAEVDVRVDEGGLTAAIAGPAEGWRFLDLEGDSRGDNPLRGVVRIEVTSVDDVLATYDVAADVITAGRAHFDVDVASAIAIRVTDAHGNTGVWSAL